MKKTTADTLIQNARMEERLEVVVEITEQLRTAVYGNGIPGLKFQVESIDARVKALEVAQSEKKDLRKENRKFGLGIIGGVITATILEILTRVFKLQ